MSKTHYFDKWLAGTIVETRARIALLDTALCELASLPEKKFTENSISQAEAAAILEQGLANTRTYLDTLLTSATLNEVSNGNTKREPGPKRSRGLPPRIQRRDR